jgi:hypothetical protein
MQEKELGNASEGNKDSDEGGYIFLISESF